MVHGIADMVLKRCNRRGKEYLAAIAIMRGWGKSRITQVSGKNGWKL